MSNVRPDPESAMSNVRPDPESAMSNVRPDPESVTPNLHSHSRFGIVVLSESFFQKHWPQLELDGLVARESAGVKVILPIWHGIDESRVRVHSPMLADRVAVSSEKGLEHVVQQLLQVITPSR